MPSAMHTGENLWQRAFNSLPEPVKGTLNQANDRKLDKLHAALKVAEDKRQLCLRKRWKKKRSGGGEDIIVRDIMEKIVQWIRRFRDIGDIIAQYDPGHVALPWAAVRFLLQSSINDMDVHTAMVEDLEMVTRLMARYDQVERQYLPQSASIDDQLDNLIVSVYAAVLEFLGKAVKFFKESTADRLFKAPFRSVNESSRDKILARDAEFLKLASLSDAHRLLNIESQVVRIADLTLVTQKQVEEKLYMDVLRWVSNVNYPCYHADHSTSRTPGTCQWLLQHLEFLSWESSSTCSLLLLHGIGGSGKTTLSSAVIDRYQEAAVKGPGKVPIAYFYCCDSPSEEERRTTSGLLRSLARQLIAFHSDGVSIHSAALNLYERLTDEAKTQGFPARSPNVTECIDLILAVVDDNPATIIIDAVDELQKPKEVMDALQTIMQKASNVVKVFVTARDSVASMGIIPAQHLIRITTDKNKNDVRMVAADAVSKAVSNFQLLTGRVEQPLKEKIIDALASSAGEMFLLIKFQLLRLSEFEHEVDVLAGMANLADSTLEALYKETYTIIIQSGHTARDIVIRIFSWLLYAREELTLDALLAASQIKQTGIDRILAICRGFIYFEDKSHVVRFMHPSVREFLRLQLELQTDQAQGLLAMSCLCVCEDPPDEDVTELRPSDRFYDYAALYYGHHCYAAQNSDQNESIVDKLEAFLFGIDSPLSPVKLWLDSIKTAYDSLPNEHQQKTAMELISAEACAPLFVICTFGLSQILKHHQWPSNFDWDQRNDYGHTALYAACFHGHADVAEFLVNRGAGLNIECGRLGSALHCAAFLGSLDIVSLLLECGVDLKIGKFSSAFHAACRGNHEEVALAILKKDIVNSPAEFDSILEAALEAGFSRVTEILCNLPWINKPTPNMADALPSGSVALAALNGKEEVVRFLVMEQKMDVQDVGELGTPLRCAALNGHSTICQLLVDLGADVNGNGNFGSALHAAAMKGQLKIVRLLINLGADVNIRGGYYGTPLQAAACLGHAETVRLLLSANANPQQNGISKDAFHAAAENGKYHIIQTFLDAGFNPLTPITRVKMRASRHIDNETRDLLRESSPGDKAAQSSRYLETNSEWRKRHGVRGRRDDFDDGKPEALADGGKSEPVPKPYRPLRRKPSDANNNAPDENYPLESAADLGHLETVSIILENHVSFHLNSSAVSKALSAACRSGHQEVVSCILRYKDIVSLRLWEPLSEATLYGNVHIIETILEDIGTVNNRKEFLEVALNSSLNCAKVWCEKGGGTGDDISSPEATFHEILGLASKKLSGFETLDLLRNFLPGAFRVDRDDIIHAFLDQKPSPSYKGLLVLFSQALEDAKPRTVMVAYDALQHRGFSQTQSQSARIILLSAGNGLTPLTNKLLCYHDRHFRCEDQLLSQALNIAAHNGHSETCLYLLSKGANSSLPTCLPSWHELSSFPELHSLTRAFENSQAEVNEIEFDLKGGYGNNDLPRHDRMRASLSRKMLMYKEANSPRNNPVTALLSSLLGYKRFNQDSPYSMRNRVWNESDKKAQDSTVRLIQAQIPSLKGIEWAEEIYNAVTFGSPDIFQLLISKNADPLTHFEGVSILEWAARRERQSFVVLQMLIEAGAVKELTENRLYHLLRETLKHFEYMEDGELLSGEASLEDAMSTGHGALVYYLLLRLPGFQLEASSSGTLLQCAAATGHYELVETLIEHGVEINHIGSYYGTALQAASRFGHVQTARILLEAGANPNICAGKHKTALRAAVLARSFQLVTLLLKSSAYDHSQDADLSIALQNALFHKDVEMALALVSAGANVQTEDHSKQPAFIHACATGNLPLINALLKAGANVNVQYHSPHWVDQKYGSPMHIAIHLEREDLVKILLANGFNLETEFGDMDHPLVFATRNGNLVALDVLLDSSSSCFSNLLGEAVKMGIWTSNLDATKRLVRHCKAVFGAENDTQLWFDLWEETCKSSNLEVTKILSEWLLDCGAMPTDIMLNALKKACAKGSAPIVGIILEKLSQHGALDSLCAEILHDLPSTSAEIYELLLEYTPCTAEMFVEACIRDYPTVAKIGLGQGMRPESIDNKDRHGYLSACINGSASVVSLLLEHDGDPNLLHPSYGNPLRAAMEGCAARKLLDLSSDEALPKDARDYLKLLVMDMPPLPSSSTIFGFKAYDDTFSYRMLRQYENVAEMLLSHGAKADTSAGHLGTALSLAAYMGLRKTCNSLLQNGASLAISGGFLQSPLAATITGGHSNMALAMMSLRPQGGSEGLCLACKRGNVSIVKALLEYGVQPTATASDGRTALQFALEKVAASCEPWSLRRYANLSTEVLNAEMILNLLLNANGISGISDQELVAATQIGDQEIRERILEIMIPRTISPYFPEEGLIQLLQNSRCGSDNLIEQLLQHRKIKEISIRVLLAVPDRRSIRPFLAYDTRYEATLAALDAKRSNSNGKRGLGSEMTVEQLLRESIAIDVSESDVLAALRLRVSRLAKNDQPDIVQLMFDRDEKLKTTEEMLKAVQTTRDLDVLLAHTSPREGLVTSAVISAVTERKRADTEEILRKLHEYREST